MYKTSVQILTNLTSDLFLQATSDLRSRIVYVCLHGAAGWNGGSGREAPHPFSHQGAEEEGDRGPGGGPGQQEISTHAPQSTGRQREPAQVEPRTHRSVSGTMFHKSSELEMLGKPKIQMHHSSTPGGQIHTGLKSVGTSA